MSNKSNARSPMIKFEGGYPTDECLRTIEHWPHEQGFNELLEEIANAWRYPEYVNSAKEGKGTRWEISTGGWSGHEDVIRALASNAIFWLFCWESSRRGGHHIFIVPGFEIR